ncbi:MAG: flavodoxin domain-containing protein [Firmicutes bacterium]|nr:flavodoxin domain-containing protein [Bacillota bacterium]
MKALVIYTSKHGCTKQSATKLAETLEADLVDASQKTNVSLEAYDTVLIGSSVYAGQILKPISEFCSVNLKTLMTKRIGFFVCCGFENKALEIIDLTFPKELTSVALTKGYFGYSFKNLGFFEKMICKMIGAPIGETDIRLENIEKFAQTFM